MKVTLRCVLNVDVCFGSLVDIPQCNRYVPPKADIGVLRKRKSAKCH